MAKGRTLWEMLVDHFRGPVEFDVSNPLKARVGSPVTIHADGYDDLNFFLREIREYSRSISGAKFVFTDYVVSARTLEGDDVTLRLRLNPKPPEEQASGITHDVLLLYLDDEMPYDRGLHDVVSDKTRKFEILEDGVIVAEYWRINQLTHSYLTKVTVVADANADAKVRSDDVTAFDIEYWDYWRELRDDADQPYHEFLFVEMRKDDGWFQIWRGHAIRAEDVVIF